MSQAASAAPSSGASDPFDALLAPAPGSSGAAPAQAPPASDAALSPKRTSEHVHEHQDATTLAAFADNWSLYRDPVLCGALAGAALAALGVFVVLRRALFVTATLSQAAGLGVALAFYAEIQFGLALPPLFAALAASVLATALVSAKARPGLAKETQIGFAFVLTSALAVLVGDRIAQEAHDIAAILFGTAVLVRPIDLWSVAAGAVVAALTLRLLARGLTFSGFDPEGAKVQGLPVRAIEVSFWLVFAGMVSVSTRALGSLPVFAFSVLPAAGALFVAARLSHAILLASLLGLLSGCLGYVAAFRFSLPVGATQAALAALFSFALGALHVAVRAWRQPSVTPRPARHAASPRRGA